MFCFFFFFFGLRMFWFFFFFSSRRRHTRWTGDWSSDVCSSDLAGRYDQVIKVVDIGKYNVGVAVIHQPASGDAAPANAGSHDGITEVYIILSGSATLTTGGTIVNAKHSGNALPTGPGLSGAIQGGTSRHVGPG